MIRARLAAHGKRLRLAMAYVLPALVLAWLAGGQMAFGRIDAALAIPFLMPGALLLAWLARDAGAAARMRVVGTALLILAGAQLALHCLLGERLAAGQLLATLIFGGLCCGVAALVVARARPWRAALRWPAMMLVMAAWFAAGQVVIAHVYTAAHEGPSPPLAMLTGLPLRWASPDGDLAAMLAAGPSDAPALTDLKRSFDVRLIDSLAEVGDGEAVLIAHPRALAPEELVRIDALAARARHIVILADALSTWPPSYPLGDSRNPPVTSLLTPLLDHWGVILAAPDPGRAGDVDVFIDPGGQKLRLHSAGRFTRLPAGCLAYGDHLVARCPIGNATVWLIGDADLLHDSLWTSPVAAAPWLRRSDNMQFLASVLAKPSRAFFEPVWIR